MRNQINKIRNENEEITTVNTEIQRIIRDNYQQLSANKIDKPLARLIQKKGIRIKSAKLEMKMEKSQQTTQKCKGS